MGSTPAVLDSGTHILHCRSYGTDSRRRLAFITLGKKQRGSLIRSGRRISGPIVAGHHYVGGSGSLAAAKAIYAGPKDARDGSAVYPGFTLGSETEWAQGQEGSLARAFSIPILQNLVYDNLSYDSNIFNWGSDIDDVDKNAGAFIDETSVNLTIFRNVGGKMLVSQGK
ncbi:Tannase/feruloyl esterase [Macrophomina phaseolina MS6]|uniref:Tannase/feruloyl esterase n=1 Tax=Macrophomina phaseolina (strain MS6) TaxID=1126212 RepID=K2RU00_MACPH|nr:Tannase/feruloyl esterase [Macrophomina phaseolina MS6]